MLIFLTACTLQDVSQDGEPIKIGGLFALTGYASFAGEASRNGFLMAIEDAGGSTQYVVEDFQSDVKNAVTAAKKLTNIDGVSVVIGPEWKEFSVAIVPIAEATTTLFISPWMTGEDMVSDYFMTATPSERYQIKKTLEYMNQQGQKNIILLYSQNAWSIGYADIFKEEIKKFPTLNIVAEFTTQQDTNDYRTEITKIQKTNPDAIFTAIATDDGQGIFGKELQEMGVDIPVYTAYSRGSSDVLLNKFSDVVEGVMYGAPSPYAKQDEFREKYRKRFGKDPSAISAATTYDMTSIVLRALKSGTKTSADVRKYIEKQEAFEGYSNIIRFDKKGQLLPGTAVIEQIQNGQRVTIAE
ncbi:penicillin-binding protein activator [Candidatus Peregrinibacteria bacterium]|nr:penicillin-binding protein activator [Candidatus Peregrinibacteria bacterium]